MVTFKKTLSLDDRYRTELTVDEIAPTSTDISNNSSRVEYHLYLKRNYTTSGKYSLSKVSSIKVILNGVTIIDKKTTYDFRGSVTSNELASGIVSIEHENDGTKTIQCSGYFKDGADNNMGSATAYGSLELTTLHKAPTINNWGISEVNPNLLNIGKPSNVFVKGLSQIEVEITNATYYDDAIFKKMVLYEELDNDEYKKIIDLATNPAIYIPTQAGLDFYANIVLHDNKNGKSEYSDESYRIITIDYTNLTLNSSAKREGQTSGQVSISCNGFYFNGTIGNVNQGNSYKPTVKYKYWEITDTEPLTYSNTVNPSDISISNGTFSINLLNIGSTTETDVNYFNPGNAYKIKLQVSDNFTELESNELLISVGEPTWTEFKDRVDFKKITIGHEPIIIIDNYKEYTGAVASGSNETLTYNIVKSGYTPFGIVGVYCSGTRSSYINVYAFYITEDKTEAKVIFKNTNDTNPLVANDSQIRIFVAYIKN